MMLARSASVVVSALLLLPALARAEEEVASPPGPPAPPARFCTVIYTEEIPEALHNLIKSDGEFRGLSGLLSDKPLEAWGTELHERCKLRITLESAGGDVLGAADGGCVEAGGSPVCKVVARPLGSVRLGPGKFRYKISSATSGQLLLDLPFSVVAWDKGLFTARSDWDALGAFVVSRGGNAHLEVVLKAASQAEALKLDDALQKVDHTLTVEVRKGKKVVASAEFNGGYRDRDGLVRTVDLQAEVGGARVPFRLESLKEDGAYVVEVRIGKKVVRTYPFAVKDGALVLHPRQAPGFAEPGRALATAPLEAAPNYRPSFPRFWLEAK